MSLPKSPNRYAVRFERGKFVLSPNPEAARFERAKRALSASTEDARLTVSARIAAILVGLLFTTFGFGLPALLFSEASSEGISALLWLLPVSVIPLLIAAYGFDLVARGIVGREWSRDFWLAVGRAADRRLPRIKPWHGVAALVLLFVVPTVADVLKRGWSGLESMVIPLAILSQVILHEAGHLAAAGAVGYRPRQLAAGPLILHVDGPRPRLSWNRSWMMLFGGLATYEPVRRTRRKDFWVIAAGPLANLLTSALALEPWDWPARSGFPGAFLSSFLWIGIAMGLINLIPFPRTAEGFALDGRELLDLIRGRR